MGRVLSREIMTQPSVSGVPTPWRKRKATPRVAIARHDGPRAVRDPEHARTHLAREPGDPVLACGHTAGRIGKSKDTRR